MEYVLHSQCNKWGTVFSAVAVVRVHTGHEKLGKSWNLRISFPGLESRNFMVG